MQAVDAGLNHHLSILFNALCTHSPLLASSILSPLSIYSALGMLAEGANGVGAEEMKSVFNYGINGEVLPVEVKKAIDAIYAGKVAGVVVKMSNSLYLQNGFPVKQEFKKAVVEKHHAHAENVDFGSPATLDLINNRITESTQGLLKNTITSLNASTACVLVNTIYFKGDWMKGFDQKNTKKVEFFLPDKTVIKVDTMFGSKLKAGVVHAQGVHLLALPYQGGEIKFVVELPTNRVLTASSVDLVLQAASTKEQNVDVWLPKFKASYRQEISNVIKSLGVKSIFTPGSLAGISDLPLAVSEIIHQAFVQVDEKGTEAAAATVVMTKCKAAPVPSVEFKVNSPFFFHIVDIQRNLILFSGSIAKPEFA